MPQITIDDETFKRLQRHARPLVDTLESMVRRAVDALDEVEGKNSVALNGDGTGPENRIDPRMLPNLTHTKVLDASIEEKPIAKANWNLCVDEVLRHAAVRIGPFEKLRKICPANMQKGRKQDEGYRYLSDIDLSIQGQDANAACRTLVTVSQAAGISVDIGFMWRLKEDAEHPGERARLKIAGTVPTKAARAAKRGG